MGGLVQMLSQQESSENDDGKVSQLFQSYEESSDESRYNDLQNMVSDSPEQEIQAMKTIQIDPDIETPPEPAPVAKTENSPKQAENENIVEEAPQQPRQSQAVEASTGD